MIIYSTRNIIEAPKKIISLVPSYSQLICQLGGSKQLIGRTKFCIHPSPLIETVPSIGGTKKVDINKIKELNPDIIVANKEENSKEDIEELSNYFTVWLSEPKTVDDSIKLVNDFVPLIKLEDLNQSVIDANKEKSKILENSFNGSVLYLIWKGPYMAAGKETFIDSMLRHLGFKNSVQAPRYPQINLDDFESLHPSFIFLSSEPYRFKENHVSKFKQMYPNSKSILVDGEAFSWHGLIFENHFEYFKNLQDSICK